MSSPGSSGRISREKIHKPVWLLRDTFILAHFLRERVLVHLDLHHRLAALEDEQVRAFLALSDDAIVSLVKLLLQPRKFFLVASLT